MSSFEWFLLIVVVVGVPLIIAVIVTLWTIDQANKRKRANRKDAQIGVKRKAALSPEEVEARKAARAAKQAGAEVTDGAVTISNHGASEPGSNVVTSSTGNTITVNNHVDESTNEPEAVDSTNDTVATNESESDHRGPGSNAN